jgi:predicted Zn finger-like uncharacterized protein
MVVECEGCGTRFNLADGQVPAGGARVRCSKCHHRFVVTPPGAPKARSSSQDSPSSGETGREEPNLDNPEFLFDDEPGDADDEPPDDDLTQNPDLEQTMVADVPGDDSSADESFEDEGGEVDEEVFGDNDDSVPSLPSPQRLAPTQVTATQALDNAVPADLDPDGEQDRANFGGPNELLGEGEADAPPSETAAEPVPDDARDLDDLGDDWSGEVEADPMSSWGSLLDGDGPAPAPVESPPPASSKPQGQPQAQISAPEPPQADDRPNRSSEIVDRVSRILAVATGLLLAVGGFRAISQNALGPTPGPEVVRGGGWAAREIDSLQLRDAAGRRLVVVRGSLSAPLERKVPPRIHAILLDAAGDPVGVPVEASLTRLSGEQLTPDALSRRLIRGSKRVPGPATGFTILIPEPPVEARRFELRLEPRS